MVMRIFTATLPKARHISISSTDEKDMIDKMLTRMRLCEGEDFTLTEETCNQVLRRMDVATVKKALTTAYGMIFIESELELTPVVLDMTGKTLDVIVDSEAPPVGIDMIVMERADPDADGENVFDVHTNAYIGAACLTLKRPRPFRKAGSIALKRLVEPRRNN
jgi:hypothetical protein